MNLTVKKCSRYVILLFVCSMILCSTNAFAATQSNNYDAVGNTSDIAYDIDLTSATA